MHTIRRCRDEETMTILAIVNAAAEAYRGVIPPDRWHDPYMSEETLRREIGAGVAIWGCEIDGELAGIMGIQPVRDVDLIRHAYVRPAAQRRGVGASLIRHLCGETRRQTLVGTWAAATWAIAFYRRHGFAPVADVLAAELLRTYWDIPDRQIETSVVLAKPPLGGGPSESASPPSQRFGFQLRTIVIGGVVGSLTGVFTRNR
jgi:GNAT superfamily N-acetyltransferase